jgi:hypothetical protein
MNATLAPQLNWLESKAPEKFLPASPPKLTPKNGMSSVSAARVPASP